MRFLVLIGAALVAESIRVSLLGRIPFPPDFLVGIVVIVALSRRPPAGSAVGLGLGLLRDVLDGGLPGTHALPLAFIGWAVGTLARTMYRDAGLTRGVMIFAGCIVHGVLVYFIATLGRVDGLAGYLVRRALPVAVLTAIAVPWLVHVLHPDRLRRLRPRRRRRKRAHGTPVLVEQH